MEAIGDQPPGTADSPDPPDHALSRTARLWFTSEIGQPTATQEQAWTSIASGNHTLVVAPTGSGKTMAAFLWAIDRLQTTGGQTPGPGSAPGASVLYVSPLKALAMDIERNLTRPLEQLAERNSLPRPVRVAVRTGDTAPADRRRLVRHPPDILITTPESLFLMLTSAARSTLTNVTTVIIDEIHSVAGSKRGAHLAVSLERLSDLAQSDPQRIGLSATVADPERMADFLTGDRPSKVVRPAARKDLDLRIVAPVDDLSAPPSTSDASGRRSGPTVWPHVYRRILDAISEHRTTLVFTNSRRLAERVTNELNELLTARSPDRQPLVRAHHGSVSKEERTQTERDLKAGRLRAVVATSSLELGIDMGAVDLVIQVEAPPSVSSGLQRVGRSGHSVGATSRGLFFPTHRGDLLASTVIVESMGSGNLELIEPPRNPLDVLAQQLVAMVAMDQSTAGDLYRTVKRADNYHNLPRSSFDAVLDMLSGRYPSEDFASLRPRLNWDRGSDLLTPRRGAQRLAVTAGGTIPDRGNFAVMLVGGAQSRRVGELDEEMVYESRVGDVFSLGSSRWRIEEITTDRVLVSPAAGEDSARMPFWRGDMPGRPARVGRAIGEYLRRFDAADPVGNDKPAQLDDAAWRNLVDYLSEQRAATGVLPDDRTVLVEEFRDEIGDRRVVIHSQLGAQVLAPWALLISDRFARRYGIDVQIMAANDGIVLRLPDGDRPAGTDRITAELFLAPESVLPEITRLVGGSALFAARFRECATRSLMFGSRQPDRRAPLWQQRLRSGQLLSAAARFDSFPVTLETVREVVQDVYDVPALVSLMQGVADDRVRAVFVPTRRPSPMARSLLFEYVAQYLYEGDMPLAERKSAALGLDQALLTELLGSPDLRELLEPAVIERVESQLQHLGNRSADSVDSAWDVLRAVGPLRTDECNVRGITSERLQALTDIDRVFSFRLAGDLWWAVAYDTQVVDDLVRLADSDAAGPARQPDPGSLDALGQRFASCHGPFTIADLAERFQVAGRHWGPVLKRLRDRGVLVGGGFLPGGSGTEWCDREILARLRRSSAAAYADLAEPVDPARFAGFPVVWQKVGQPSSKQLPGGESGLYSVIESLAGAPLPAARVESLILPSRIRDYHPRMLDQLISTGAVTWWGIANTPAGGWIGLAPSQDVSAYLPENTPSVDAPAGDSPAESTGTAAAADRAVEELEQQILDLLAAGGGWFRSDIAARLAGVPAAEQVREVLLRLLWSGRITNDTLAPLRRGALKRPRRQYRSRRTRPMPTPDPDGRWSALPGSRFAEPESALLRAESLLRRHGIVSRRIVLSERLAYGPVYRTLSSVADHGGCLRGYFVSGMGGSQFATSRAVDDARGFGRADRDQPTALVLAAADPANPYGAALEWPAVRAPSRPSRGAGSIVVLVSGLPVIYLEGGSNLLVWDQPEATLREAANGLMTAVGDGRVAALRIRRINGTHFESSPITEVLLAVGAHRTPSAIRIR